MLAVNGITKSYGHRLVIGGASFRLPAGEVLCLIGPSGIGKTTLLEIIAGLVPPDGGTVHAKGRASLLFQDNCLIPWLNAAANVQYILSPATPAAAAEACARKWLDRFGLEYGQFPAAMSSGMLRRLALARAFAAAYPLLLLDEPFAFLDEAWQRVVAEETASHAANGGSVLVTSHTTEPFGWNCFNGVPCGIAQLAGSPLRLDG
ncbi:MAG: ATP-binding protein [Deltaproteobacteria bacterium]|jgi:ABC-type nitrate/sulfonate/bicarbonate transport system ATPase subunit|nr:ATP-binding protein [Deltaproteobacteria bacterium]